MRIIPTQFKRWSVEYNIILTIMILCSLIFGWAIFIIGDALFDEVIEQAYHTIVWGLG